MPKARLTEEAVKRLKPTPKRQIDYFDAGLPGLVLRVSYGGTKTWLALHYLDGKPKWFRLGRYHHDGSDAFVSPYCKGEQPRSLTLKGARDGARAFFGDKDNFLNPRAPALAKSSFETVAESYILKHAARFRSRAEMERCLKKYVYPEWKGRAFEDIKRSDVISLRSDIAENHGARQADTVFAIIRGIMKWYEDEGDDDNYVCPIKQRKRKNALESGGRDRILNNEEIRAVWKAADHLGLYGSLLKLLLLTAQRREKVVTMKWTDISGDIWTIPREPREKSNAGSLRLPPLAVDILNSIDKVAGCSFVFAGRYRDKHFNSFSQGKTELNAKLPPNMAHWTLHDLRRTARTIMTDLNISDRVAEQVLGHTVQGVERVYNRSQYLAQKADALQRLADHIKYIVDLDCRDASAASCQIGI